MVMLLALGGSVHAEMTVSQSNDPAASLNMNIVSLLGQERTALDGVTAGRLKAITATPVSADKAKAWGKVKAPAAYDEAWLATLPTGGSGAELECLARAVYFEARGESIKGQAAVAEVVLNRVDSPSFPRSVCGVVGQGGQGGCAFSFTCDGLSDRISEPAAWDRAKRVANAMMAGMPRVVTDGATYFHTPAVRPSWARRFELTTRIGSHIFYRAPVVTALN